MGFEKFNELEERIKKIVEDYILLKRDYSELKELLERKDRELEEAGNRIKNLSEEKESIREKVDSLLDMLHDVTVSQ